MTRPTFRIEELHIRSFRGIDDLHLGFPVNEREPGGLAVLAGDNGCGKTAVLEAILLVLGRVDLLPADAADLVEQVRLGAADFEISAKLRTPGFQTGVTEFTVTSHLPPPTRPGPTGEVPNGPFWEKVLALQPNVEYFSARREPEGLGDTPDPRGARAVREARRVFELKRKIVSAYYRSLRASKGGKMPPDSPFARLQAFVQRFLGEEHVLDEKASVQSVYDGSSVPAHARRLASACRSSPLDSRRNEELMSIPACRHALGAATRHAPTSGLAHGLA